MRLAAAVVGLLAVVGCVVWYLAIREPEPRDDVERFQGEWGLADGRRGGAGDSPPAVGVRVTGDRWQYVAAGVEGRAYRLTLNEAATPREIDLELLDTAGLVGPAPRLRGVYAFEGGGKVRVRVRDASQPRPRSLDDDEATDWVLTRTRLEPAEPRKR